MGRGCLVCEAAYLFVLYLLKINFWILVSKISAFPVLLFEILLTIFKFFIFGK